MAKVLRQEIIEDQGYSRLKQRALDLITNLRLEADILNEKKNGSANRVVNSNAKGANINPVNEKTQMKTETEIL